MMKRYEFVALIRSGELDEELAKLADIDLTLVYTGVEREGIRAYRIFGLRTNVEEAALALRVDADQIYAHGSDPKFPAADDEELSYDEVEAIGLDGTGRDGDPRFPYRWSNLTDDERRMLGIYRDGLIDEE